MKPYFEILMNNWEFLAPVIYEIIARLWPTKWNVSILDNGWKILNWIIPNLRKKKGNEMMANEKQNFVPVNINKHVLKALLVLFMFAPLIQADAQIWQNFKGIRLVNESDTAQQLSVQGSLFYDDVIDSLYLYNGTKWVNLMRGGSTPGGAFWPLSGSAALTDNVLILGAAHDVVLGSGIGSPINLFNVNADNITQNATGELNLTGHDNVEITSSIGDVTFAGGGGFIVGMDGDITMTVDNAHTAIIQNYDGISATTATVVDAGAAAIAADNGANQSSVNAYTSGDIGINASSNILANSANLDITATQFDFINEMKYSGAVNALSIGPQTGSSQISSINVYGTDASSNIFAGALNTSLTPTKQVVFSATNSDARIKTDANFVTRISTDSVMISNATGSAGGPLIVLKSDEFDANVSSITFRDPTQRVAYIKYSSVTNALTIGRGGQDIISIGNDNQITFLAVQTSCGGSGELWNDGGTLKICP